MTVDGKVVSDYEVFSKVVHCVECETSYIYLVESPPIPMIVRRFINDEGRSVSECWCGEELIVPPEAP